ncbi:hypothetical protein NECAME_14774, partial [Necator americanus]
MRAATIPGTQEYDANRRHQARVLRVSTIAERPYVMLKILPSGKVTYEGFCVDLLDRLASSLHISYEISIVKDGKYGEPTSSNGSEWDGMIGEILRGVNFALRPGLNIFNFSVWTFSATATLATALLLTLIAVSSPSEYPDEFNVINSVCEVRISIYYFFLSCMNIPFTDAPRQVSFRCLVDVHICFVCPIYCQFCRSVNGGSKEYAFQ